MQLVSTISPPHKISAFHYQLTMVTTFTVRGDHIYKAAWSPYIGEEMPEWQRDDFLKATKLTKDSPTTTFLLNGLATCSKHV